jgi:hypothetical protein
MLGEFASEDEQVAYLNEGYMVGGGFVARAEGFSETDAIPRLETVPDDEYYARRDMTDEMQVPASLDSFFDRFADAAPEIRDKLLTACYWRHLGPPSLAHLQVS